MALIHSRKHPQSRLQRNISTALAVMLLPAAHMAQADNGAADAQATPPTTVTLPEL